MLVCGGKPLGFKVAPVAVSVLAAAASTIRARSAVGGVWARWAPAGRVQVLCAAGGAGEG
jgi:hypothetical protein